MAEERSEWQTPNEIRKTLGPKKCDALLDDLGHERKSRPEILESIMNQTGCNVYSADDFLRDLLKHPNAG
jgi:hypothetical protein